jgi:hypothetical protein
MFYKGMKMLLMGSSKYRKNELPPEIQEIIDTAIQHEMTFIVAEAHGACRLFQDYLAAKKYNNVIIGHARSLRYNAGNWSDHKYGDNLKEREINMIKDCVSAVVIWQDNSGFIAENLENLKMLSKPTYLFEYHSRTGHISTGMLDPYRIYRTFYPFKR